LSSRRKLFRLLSLVCGVFLIVASPFFIFYRDSNYPPGVRGGKDMFGKDMTFPNIYYTSFGVFLLIAGFVLVVASYYRRGETNLPMKI
jgi:hypothetical protein